MSLAIISRILGTAEASNAANDGIKVIEKDGFRLCSISKYDIERLSTTIMHSTFQSLSGIDQGRTLQIVGDSLPAYDQDTSIFISASMQSLIEDSGITRVVYGLTGRVDVNGYADINHLVNLWLDEKPEVRAHFTWGIVTDMGTVNAVSQNDYSFSEKCVNFIVINGGASFGDEIRFTDAITDVLLVAEGGVQCFCQVVNVLSRPGTIVHAYPNLRHRNSSTRFSAAQFLLFIRTQANHISPDLLDRFCFELSPLSASQFKELETAWFRFLTLQLATRIPDIIFHYQ